MKKILCPLSGFCVALLSGWSGVRGAGLRGEPPEPRCSWTASSGRRRFTGQYLKVERDATELRHRLRDHSREIYVSNSCCGSRRRSSSPGRHQVDFAENLDVYGRRRKRRLGAHFSGSAAARRYALPATIDLTEW